MFISRCFCTTLNRVLGIWIHLKLVNNLLFSRVRDKEISFKYLLDSKYYERPTLGSTLTFFISVGAVNESSGKGKFYYVRLQRSEIFRYLLIQSQSLILIVYILCKEISSLVTKNTFQNPLEHAQYCLETVTVSQIRLIKFCII